MKFRSLSCLLSKYWAGLKVTANLCTLSFCNPRNVNSNNYETTIDICWGCSYVMSTEKYEIGPSLKTDRWSKKLSSSICQGTSDIGIISSESKDIIKAHWKPPHHSHQNRHPAALCLRIPNIKSFGNFINLDWLNFRTKSLLRQVCKKYQQLRNVSYKSNSLLSWIKSNPERKC